MRLRTLLFLSAVVSVSAVLWAQDKAADASKDPPSCPVKYKGRSAFPVDRTESVKTCSKDKKTFNHKLHTTVSEKMKEPAKCNTCHIAIEKDNPARGESLGDIRRPAHKACLACHGIVPKDQKTTSGNPMPSFYDTDPKTRTICANCHGDAVGADNKPVSGSYNDMTKPLKAIDYNLPADQPPCDVDFGFDFSHKTHAGEQCTECHAPVADCKDYKKDDKGNVILDDFGNPKECVTVKDASPCDLQVFSSPSHPQCWKCHNKDAKPREDGKDPFSKAGSDRCESCHNIKQKNITMDKGALDSYFSQKKRNRDMWAEYFTHKNHMAFLTKTAPSAPPDAQCRICHQSQVNADSLAEIGTALHDDIDQKNTCFCCHDGSPGPNGTASVLISNPTACYECHRPPKDFGVPSGTHVCKDSKAFDTNFKTLLGIEKFPFTVSAWPAK